MHMLEFALMNKTNVTLVSFLSALILAFVVLFAVVGSASADTGASPTPVPCPTQYGSGQYGGAPCPQNLTVNKQVRNPITGTYVENLLAGDATYSLKSEVVYSLKITNTSSASMSSVLVTDTLPAELKDAKVVDATRVTEEKYDASNRKLTFKLSGLGAGETRDILVKATVIDSVSVESGKDKKCEVKNYVKVETTGVNPDEDTAELCIQTQVLGKTTLPSAGVEDVLPLVPFMGMGLTGIGLFLKRK